MSYADKVFVENIKDILKNGTSTENQHNRTVWEDGSVAWTKQLIGASNRYDLRKEFPAMTLRKTALKSAMDEILWIYQKKSNNINDLNSSIWDEWADNNGSIGKAYGYQVGKKYKVGIIEKMNITDDSNKLYPSLSILNNYVYMDQMDYVLYQLKNDPFSRRIMISLWNVNDLLDMNLQPCCWSVQFLVADEGKDKLVLNMVLNQRSADMLTANNWNVSQYAILLMMVAQCSNMIPGELIHNLGNYHIYNKHFDLVTELINREQYEAPIVKLNSEISNFYDFRTSDLIVDNYKFGEQIKIPVAI